MEKIAETLNNGKTVYFNTSETHYYRLINFQLHYSKNLSTWKLSSIPLSTFIMIESAWEVL